ncbi:hypothetical protein BB559_002598 [Furculomyces boomerangus]|uniref:Cation efflux protein transmembrane domain-containing protein n=2 Tax=Harpellales TaxID=61421 RepID=A0A2T9YU85_9FUNG|nr:hypothetical protein BB559_002598 [Furculomyces boomerangus]PWA01952.1 hypothetical protein BB558_001918 [Smittium angustum]
MSRNNNPTIRYPFGLSRLPILTNFVNGIILSYFGINTLKETLEHSFTGNDAHDSEHVEHSLLALFAHFELFSCMAISVLILHLGIPTVLSSGKILIQSITPEFEQNLTSSLDEILNIQGVVSYSKNGVWMNSWEEPEGFLDVYVQPEVDLISTQKRIEVLLAGSVGGRWTIQLVFVDK